MAFDWTTVEGYRDDMSADEKLALLENYTAPTTPAQNTEPDNGTPAPAESGTTGQAAKQQQSYAALKREFDKVSSQLAAMKREQRANMTVEQQREAEREEERANIEAELKSLRREKAIGNYRASFMGLGLDENQAANAATMLQDGDAEGLFDALKQFQVGHEKTLRAKILAETPKPPAGGDPSSKEAREKADRKLNGYFGLPANYGI